MCVPREPTTVKPLEIRLLQVMPGTAPKYLSFAQNNVDIDVSTYFGKHTYINYLNKWACPKNSDIPAHFRDTCLPSAFHVSG